MEDFLYKLTNSKTNQQRYHILNSHIRNDLEDILNYHSISEEIIRNAHQSNGNRNLIVYKDKTKPSLVISAHYDSFRNGNISLPGANDNGSGIVCALDLFKKLSKNYPSINTSLAFLGSEEYGRAGSKDFAIRHKNTNLAVILDTVGYSDTGKLVIPKPEDLKKHIGNYGKKSKNIIEDFKSNMNKHYDTTGSVKENYLSDQVSFLVAGYKSILISAENEEFFEFGLIHSEYDTIDRINFDFIKTLSDNLAQEVPKTYLAQKNKSRI